MSMVFVLLLLPQWLELNTLQKDTICKDILWQQGENPVFLFDKFLRDGKYHPLKRIARIFILTILVLLLSGVL
jgi:hypothetical protein